MIKLHAAVMVHGLAHVQAALAPGLPLTLISAPGAAQYAGCLWWRELLAAAAFNGTALLDCGDAPGRALEALKLGLGGLVLRTNVQAFALVMQIAQDQGAILLDRAPPALDLAKRGANRQLMAWLGG